MSGWMSKGIREVCWELCFTGEGRRKAGRQAA